MRKIKIREMKLGDGIPKICVPIVATDIKTLEMELEGLKGDFFDFAEWRMDWFVDILDEKKRKKALNIIRKALKGKPLLATFRTEAEGGERDIVLEDYKALNCQVIATGEIDLIDIEFMMPSDIIRDIQKVAEEYAVKTVFSSHDFENTPKEEEIVKKLRRMETAGADIAKIAVMPEEREDVLVLMQATLSAYEEMRIPIITMSMGRMGMASRVVGGEFGSVVTFGSVGRASAPGQLKAEELRKALRMMR